MICESFWLSAKKRKGGWGETSVSLLKLVLYMHEECLWPYCLVCALQRWREKSYLRALELLIWKLLSLKAALGQLKGLHATNQRERERAGDQDFSPCLFLPTGENVYRLWQRARKKKTGVTHSSRTTGHYPTLEISLQVSPLWFGVR